MELNDLRDRIIAEVARSQGVLITLYALIRDMGIANMVDEDKNGKLGDVIGDTVTGLDGIIDLWDERPEEEKNGEQ